MAMLPKDFMIGMLIFFMLVTGIVTIVITIERGTAGEGGIDAVSGFVQDDELTAFNRSFSDINGTSSTINELHTNIINLVQPEDLGDIISLPIAFVKTAWSLVRTVAKSFTFLNSAFNGLTGLLGVPSFVPTFIILIVLAVAVFAILSIIFQRDI